MIRKGTHLIIFRSEQQVLRSGVLRITRKGLYAGNTIGRAPFHYLPIDEPPWLGNAAVEGGATRVVSYSDGNYLPSPNRTSGAQKNG